MDTRTQDDKRKDMTKLWYKIAKRIAIVAAVLAGILSVLMIVNYLQTKSVDPLNNQAISQLMTQLQENPSDTALKEQIRALDLLARKAYFTHQWQIKTGSYLLFAVVLVLLLALKYMSSLQPRLPDLSKSPEPDEIWENKFISRKYILFGGLGLFILAFILGILSQTELKNIGIVKTKGSQGAAVFPSIEEIRNNWPGFRGPEGIGMAYHTDVPTEWDGPSGQNILWKTPIPHPGYNSPIIWEKKIFLSGADRRTQVVYCVDANSGEIIWQTELNDIPGSPERRPQVTEDTGYAAPTMTTDGKMIFALFATGDIACLDFEGNRIWAKNLGMPANHYGHASSLITYRDLLIIQFDQNTGGRLLALKTLTGDLAYDQPRDVEISWASPILVNTGSRTELILNSNPFVMSHDPQTGQELWRVRCMQGEIAPSPAYADGMVFVVNDYARLAAIKLGETPDVAWEYIDDLSEVSSPLAANDLVIMAASFGTVTCFDRKTGERLWVQEFSEGFYSSPILTGDSVYLMDMSGVMYVFKAEREFQLINRNELGESAMTIPAFMHNRIYIRGEKNLFCIGDLERP
ncbi:MAG: PQQ-binding-like beta-propeller repeat protein [Candidatus Aminicenantes bacterium]|nr:PQQ-binding-like beta-propeller repeat protein [Candidatus Aminicenantes bacterium]